MTYEIALTKWRAVALVAITCCLAGLLFFCGVLVGVGLWQPTREEIQMAREYRRQHQPAAPAPVQAAAAASVPPPQAAAIAAPAHAAAEPVAPAPAEHPAPSIPPPAAPAAHETPVQTAAVEPLPFVLQVGSFRDPKNAKQLQTELAGKGYQATVFNALDSEQRMWHVVRVGHYQDVASAASDAAKIGDKEQLQALIRRGDRL
jgi:cell division protein FtsN